MLINLIQCEVCGGELLVSQEDTINSYLDTVNINTDNLFNKVDEIIGKYIVYKCDVCGHTYKYTYKDLETVYRKQLTEQYLLLLARGRIVSNSSVAEKFFIYCGKCNGFDGEGSCPPSVYNKCEIKRFPAYE